MIELQSVITCPNCSHVSVEIMPTDACQYIYVCKSCGTRLKPKKGDCCVYCSYGSVPCPPIQAQRAAPDGTDKLVGSSEHATRASDLMKHHALELAKLHAALSNARRAGDTQAVRGGFIESLLAVQDALTPVTGPGPVQFIEDIVQALHAAGRGHRHWLTALPEDLRRTDKSVLPVWRDDPERALLMAQAAALLDHYSRPDNSEESHQLSIAAQIAEAMERGCFKTDRGKAPSAETIKDWRKNMLASKKRKRRAPHRLATRYFQEKLQHLARENCRLSEALLQLETSCRNATPLPVATPVKLTGGLT